MVGVESRDDTCKLKRVRLRFSFLTKPERIGKIVTSIDVFPF